MTAAFQSSSPEKSPRGWKRNATRWLRNTAGTAALEFSLVAIPFFFFVLAILGSSLYFFASNALERGVQGAARKIRTGEAKESGTTVGGFRELVCNEAGTGIDCKKLRVLIQSDASWANITPQDCLDNNNEMVNSTGNIEELVSDYSGDANFVAHVTLCYEWDLAKTFSFLQLGKGANGSGPAVMQASTAFRIEPHPYE
jgi:Flp pilus assembly protein TadG